MSAANAAPYHAGPGTAHEIGIMIAFIAAFILSMGAYYLVWRVGNKRSEKREVARREAWGKMREGGGEKGMGMGMGDGGEGEREREREREREQDGDYVREILNGYGNGKGVR
ncbi:uracil phosphoribosyltransferase [Physcia stellaris]|nr:uracil phosphoribosyltransferase [Physcia stellaris]